MSGDKLTVGWSSIVLNGMDSPPRDVSSSSTRAGLIHMEMAGFSSVPSLNCARLFVTPWTDGRVTRGKQHTKPFEAKAWHCATLSTFSMARPVTGFPGSTSGKESTCQAGDARDAASILGSGRSPREGNGNPLQYACLGNSVDRGPWRTAAHRITKGRIQLSTNVLLFVVGDLVALVVKPVTSFNPASE